MNKIAIDNGLEEAELQMKHNHHHIGVVSPDLNSGYLCNGNRGAKKCADARANIIMSPSSRTSLTPSSQLRKGQLHVVTPLSTATPTKNTPSPLKSPFRNSMALLDSKLDSLKKEDVALHAKIESMNAWLDGSGMEDSFDGELVFDVDFGDDDTDLERDSTEDSFVNKYRLNEFDVAAVDHLSINSQTSTFRPSNQSACDVKVTRINHGSTGAVIETSPNGEQRVVKSFGYFDSRKHRPICANNIISANTSGTYGKTDALKCACIEDSDLSCKQLLGCQTGLLSNHTELDESQISFTNDIIHLHETPSEAGRSSYCKSSQTGVSEKIDQMSYADSAAPACYEISPTEKNESLFFSPVDASESQIYFTPYNRNRRLDSRQPINLFSAATAVCKSASDAALDDSSRPERCEADFYGSIEVSRKFFPTGHSCTSHSEPSLCPTDVSNIQALWTDQRSFKCEAVDDLSKVMSTLEVGSVASKFGAGKASFHISNAGCRVSSAQSCNSQRTAPKQHSSPIQPKKLDLISGDDDSDMGKKATISVRGGFAQKKKLAALDSELQRKPDKASTCTATGYGDFNFDCTESKNCPAAQNLVTPDESIANEQTMSASAECLSSVSPDNVRYYELQILVAKLRDQLAEANATCEALKLERDAIRLERDATPETNPLSIALKSNPDEMGNYKETAGKPKSELESSQICTRESSFLSGEDELEQAIELVISSVKSRAGSDIDTSRAYISCKSCMQFADEITCLKLENEWMQAELEACHQCHFTSNVSSSISQDDRANTCNDDGNSTPSSQHAQSAELSALEGSFRNAIQSRNRLEESHDLERDLCGINAGKESSRESFRSDKLIADQQRDEMKSEVYGLEEHLHLAQSEQKLIESKFDVANDTIKSMNDKIIELQSEQNANTQKRKTEAKNEIGFMSDERKKQEQSIKGLLSRLTVMDEEKSALEGSLAELSLSINNLQQQVKQKECIIDDLGQTINNMKAPGFESLEYSEINKSYEYGFEHLWTPKKKTSTSAVHGIEQHRSPQEPKICLVENTRDRNSKLHRHHNRLESIAATLAVIVIQQKLRASTANKQRKSMESELFGLSEQLAVAELSIGELNADRSRLVEDVVRLKDKNEALSMKLEAYNTSRPSSEALVLEGECGVEAVNCTSYSSITELASSRCCLNLQSTIGNLAFALVKLKIRERCLSRKIDETTKLQSRNELTNLQNQLPNVALETNTISYSINDSKSEIAATMQKTQQHSARALIELSPPESTFQHQNVGFELENIALTDEVTELQTKNTKFQCTNKVMPSSRDIDREVNDLALQIDALKQEHELEKQAATNELDQVKFDLLQEKEAASMLRAQLDYVLSQNDELQKTTQMRVDEHHRLVQAVSSLKVEIDSLNVKVAEYEHANIDSYKQLKSCEYQLELSEKLRLQLQSQLDAETNATQNKIEELSRTKEETLSAMNRKINSLASERDQLSAQLVTLTHELSALKCEHENLKHSYNILSRDGTNRTDSSVRTFSSCEHLGTICEEERPLSPGRDIIEILSATQLSKNEIRAVSDKMHQLHSILSKVQEERLSLKQEVKELRDFKESSSHLDMLLRKNSDSLRSHLIESQNEIARLKRELETRDQPRITNFTSPFTTFTNECNRPQFELSLETPRVSNLATKNYAKSSPKYRKSKSPQESNKVRSKERFEVKKGISIFNMFKDTKKTGRKDFIKYRDADKDSPSANSSDPISPGEKRKREQAELMIKSLRRRYEV